MAGLFDMLRGASEAGFVLHIVQAYVSYNTLAPIITHKEFHVVNKLCDSCMSNKSEFQSKEGSSFVWFVAVCLIGYGTRYKRALAGNLWGCATVTIVVAPVIFPLINR